MLLVFVLIAGASFVGASFWQPAQPRVVTGRALPALTPMREETPPLPASVSPPVSAPTQAHTAAQPDSKDTALPNFAPGVFAVNWQIPASEPVDAAYFSKAIFFGDSLITGFVTHQLLRNAAVVAAIGATPATALEEPLIRTTGGMYTMLEAAQEMGPRYKIYIMLGSQGLTLNTYVFTDGYRQFIYAVRAQYPDATVYIMSMPPVAAHVGEHHPEVSRERVIELNWHIAELARASGLHFLNIFDALAGADGYLPAHASIDGLHLSPEYHFILLDFLKSHTVDPD